MKRRRPAIAAILQKKGQVKFVTVFDLLEILVPIIRYIGVTTHSGGNIALRSDGDDECRAWGAVEAPSRSTGSGIENGAAW